MLIGVGIGLAFPTLGAAAAADIPAERFGVASAVTGVGRQLGAVLGTVLLIAIIGDPESIQAAGDRADGGFLLGIGAGIASAIAVVRLKPVNRSSPESHESHVQRQDAPEPQPA